MKNIWNKIFKKNRAKRLEMTYFDRNEQQRLGYFLKAFQPVGNYKIHF